MGTKKRFSKTAAAAAVAGGGGGGASVTVTVDSTGTTDLRKSSVV